MRPRRIRAEGEGKDRDFVVALARGLDILRAFRGGEGEALGNGDLAQRTGLSRSTVSRLTHTLHKLEYLSHDPRTARYRLAPPVLSLGFSCLAGMALRDLARPQMQALAEDCGMPVALAGRDRLSMVYLARCRGSNAVTLAIEVGAHIKLASSALGRAYIAALDEPARLALLDRLRAHEGADWPELRRGIEAAIEQHATHGYCLSLAEWKPEVHAVAVPYLPADGSPLVAFNCGGPAQLLPRERIEAEIAPRLLALVRQLPAHPRQQTAGPRHAA